MARPLHTKRQVDEMQAALDKVMEADPSLRRLSDRKMNALVRRIAEAYDRGLRGEALVAAALA